MTPTWAIRNVQRALIVIRLYAADMRAKGILAAVQWADGVAGDIEDKLAGRKPFPNYRPELANLSAAAKPLYGNSLLGPIHARRLYMENLAGSSK